MSVPVNNDIEITLEGPSGEIETCWADRSGDGYYVLDNVPWLAHRVSLGDTIEALPSPDGQLKMTRVVRKSGNRTLRVLLEISEQRKWTPSSQALVAGIRERGGEIENMNNRLVAVSLPPDVDLLGVAAFIHDAGFQFEYADPTFEELYPEASAPADLRPLLTDREVGL